ncbi:MAG: RelA/SpoT family protein [Candidatus Pacebacteria bacterium]|nr:RelA/SpoT family protein [Candidatus Paceibacterota bacterium]
MTKLPHIISQLQNATPEDIDLVTRAYHYAEKAHADQKRFSGEPYFLHLEETALILAEWKMDSTTVAAGLLHDIIEDTSVTEKDIEKEFGKPILFLIEGVTKLGKLKYRGVERHVESLRKLFMATSKDVRVIIVKLADKLHNMRTLGHVPKEKQRRIALEALEIYAPIANRLGMGYIKGELEDLVFQYTHPKEHEESLQLFKQRSHRDKAYLEKVYRSLQKELVKHNITNAHVDYRLKHLYSFWKKLQHYKMDVEKIYDVVALRVIVPSVEDCYRVLGIVHNMWKPLPGRIKDYIALPKPNGYQSLHTTIFTGDGGIAEIQIRTEAMHAEAEYGVAAWFAYKEMNQTSKKKTSVTKKEFQQKYAWARDVASAADIDAESKEFLSEIKTDMFEDRIFIFTPKGDVVDLPTGSGPIDFAYAIHSDIGNKVSGTKINGKMTSLDTILNNGDIVEILTRKDANPSSKWLDYVKTSTAKKHIKQYVQENSLMNKFLKNWNS